VEEQGGGKRLDAKLAHATGIHRSKEHPANYDAILPCSMRGARPGWQVFIRGGFLSILLSIKVSSSEMPISTSYAAVLDPRHRVLGALGRHDLWQGRGGLTSLVGRCNCLQPDRSPHGASQAGPVLGTGLWQSTHRVLHLDGRERQLGSRGRKGNKPLILRLAPCPLINPSLGHSSQGHWNHYPHRLSN